MNLLDAIKKADQILDEAGSAQVRVFGVPVRLFISRSRL